MTLNSAIHTHILMAQQTNIGANCFTQETLTGVGKPETGAIYSTSCFLFPVKTDWERFRGEILNGVYVTLAIQKRTIYTEENYLYSRELSI